MQILLVDFLHRALPGRWLLRRLVLLLLFFHQFHFFPDALHLQGDGTINLDPDLLLDKDLDAGQDQLEALAHPQIHALLNKFLLFLLQDSLLLLLFHHFLGLNPLAGRGHSGLIFSCAFVFLWIASGNCKHCNS